MDTFKTFVNRSFKESFNTIFLEKTIQKSVAFFLSYEKCLKIFSKPMSLRY